MYSPDGRKEWYLEECKKFIYEEPTIELLIKIFNSIELEEEGFTKDVSEFSDDEVIDLLKSLNSKSRRRLKSVSDYLSKYYQWCKDKGVITNIINPFDDRTIISIINEIIPEEVYNDKYFGKKEIEEWMDLLEDPMNQFIFIAPFYGIKGDELLNLKMEDLNNETKEVKLITNRVAKVDDLFIKHMKWASTVEKYKSETEINSRNYNKHIYVKNGYVIRTCGGGFDYKPARDQFLNNRLQLVKKQIGNEFITIPTLYRNGLINYIKERFSERGISLTTAIFQEANSKLYTYDSETQQYIEEFGSKTPVRMIRMEMKDIIQYYE